MTDPHIQPFTTTDPRLSQSLPIDPAEPIEQWRMKLPGKGACYLFSDGDDRPVLMATVGNLRNAVHRRFTQPDDDEQPSKRIDYRAVVRHIRWRPTFSRFEADWVYLETARRLMPAEHRRWVGTWRCHWLAVDPDEPFPRWGAIRRIAEPAGQVLGPLPDASAARRYIEMLEDLFDLCRYHDILTQAPQGKACAYKEMGKCPAPCDGTVSMGHYRQQIRDSIAFATEPLERRQQAMQQQMRRAADALDFEQAARIKQHTERARTALAPAYRHMFPLDRFRYLSLQRGSGKRKVRCFYIDPTAIHFLGEMQPKQQTEQIDWMLQQIEHRRQSPTTPTAPTPHIDKIAGERIGLAAWHLLRDDDREGRFLPADQLTVAVIRKTIDELTR